MGHAYGAVGWNRQKKLYDLWLWLGILIYVGIFLGVGFSIHPNATAETMLIRAFGTGAFLLLHIILMIGPLARLDNRFLPLLYNRRHMGVSMFILALAHGAFSIIQFHAAGDTNPLVSIFTSNMRYDSIAYFPFHPLGFFALIILFLMAATSHDFWLANLSAPVWKALHMLVYVAYFLLVAHVTLGVLQQEIHPALTGLVGIGMFLVCGLHLAAAQKEKVKDVEVESNEEGWVNACDISEIPINCAVIKTIRFDRVAIWKYDGKISVISNACQHQNGPLGEGRMLDGFVTCPWHGYQYRPEDGASPDPFTEKVPTFKVKIIGSRVWVYNIPNLPGTYVEPALIREVPEEARG